ncbi:MAG: hypothetical protein C5B51_30235 [Terriglobia bacterium]|nr:MAG: hypothetical protein C5B51_30235 [Terriglobia bacterium]
MNAAKRSGLPVHGGNLWDLLRGHSEPIRLGGIEQWDVLMAGNSGTYREVRTAIAVIRDSGALGLVLLRSARHGTVMLAKPAATLGQSRVRSGK